MKKKRNLLLACLALLMGLHATAQNTVELDYTPQRTFKNNDGDNIGTSSYYQCRIRLNNPISVTQNNDGQRIIWTGTLNGTYAILNNKGFADGFCPEKVLNLSYNFTHIRPISKKWSVFASLGIGMFAEPTNLSLSSLIANGTLIFSYHVRNNLQVGIGAALSTSYGVPTLMPVPYLRWRAESGKYEIVLDPTKQYISRQFGDKLKLSLVATELDGMSAVFKQEGRTRLYSNMRMRSYIKPELKINKKSSLYANFGIVYMENVKVSSRSYKGFANSFKKGDRYNYTPTFNLVIGYQHKL